MIKYTDLRSMTIQGPTRLRASLTLYSADNITTLDAAWRKATAKCAHGATRATCQFSQCAGQTFTPKGK